MTTSFFKAYKTETENQSMISAIRLVEIENNIRTVRWQARGLTVVMVVSWDIVGKRKCYYFYAYM